MVKTAGNYCFSGGANEIFTLRGALLLASLAVAAFSPSPVGEPATSPVAASAKSCSSGWTHAIMPNGHKCLRAGQFCSHRRGFQSRYHAYGFHCKPNGRLRRN